MRLPCSPFTFFTLFSLSVHALLAAWIYYQPPKKNLNTKKSDTIAISVGLQAAIAGANISASAAKPVQEVKPQSQPTPKIATLPTHQSVVTPKVIPKKPEVKKVVNKPALIKKTSVKKSEEKKVITQKITKPVEKLKVATVKSTSAQGLQGSVTQAVSKQKETGTGNQAKLSGNNEAAFDFYVRQHLLSKKVSPNVLRSRNKKGVVVIEFTIDRQGNVLAHKIAKSSKIREFDRAAVQLIRQAAPFPKAPNTVFWATRKFTIDLNYSVL